MKTPRQVWPTLVALLAIWAFVTPLLAQEIETLQKGVVMIRATSSAQSPRTGTGFIVRRGADVVYIITASHVVEGAKDIEVEFFTQRNRRMPAKVLQKDWEDPQGLAALAVQGNIPSDIVVLKMNRGGLLRAGDPVTMIGFPDAGGPWAVTKGEVVGRKAKSIVFSGAIEEGNSGGPLIHEGQVIGVVTGTHQKFAYAAPTVIAQYVLESWGVKFGDQLRSNPATLEPGYVVQMIREKGFNHPGDMSKEGGSGYVRGNFQHEYEEKTFGGIKVVIDHATDLMWEQSGSGTRMAWKETKGYIDTINAVGHAGFSDWRLPTVEELASLLEPIGENKGLYIDPAFDPRQSACWSSDESAVSLAVSQAYTSPTAWGVDYKRGTVFLAKQLATSSDGYCTRAVRSVGSDPREDVMDRPPGLSSNLANTEIAFVSNRDGPWDIYVMNADGTNPRRLTNSPEIEQSPLWSPDRTKIAFVIGRNSSPGDTYVMDGRDIYVMNVDGTNPRRLTANGPGSIALPAWSPDSTKIAFSAFRGCDREDYVINADGTNRVLLQKLRGCGRGTWDRWWPSWSPDGTKIAFPAYDSSLAIHVLHPDGNDPKLYTPLGDRAHDYKWWVSWSPDGRKIGFVARSGTGHGQGIYVMNADGSGIKQLAEFSSTSEHVLAAWSPKGDMIAFASKFSAESHGIPEIYVIDVDSSNLRRLTDTPAAEGHPSWSPDGTTLVFASRRAGNWEIYTMNADGTEPQRLTHTPQSEAAPSWSPFPK
jgi:TolB protein